MEKYIVENIKDFNLEHIFDCGQCFRWEREEDGSYTGVAFDRAVNMSFQDGSLTIENSGKEDFQKIWYPYLHLDRNYSLIKKTLREGDPVMDKAIAAGEGIRILRQDLWETILSFLISQNNNIPRIKGCIENLARLYGNKVSHFRGRDFYAVPGPETLAPLDVEDLAPVKLGYRARYIIESARMVLEKGLPENYEELSALCGVGPKVANCIMLFGMGKYDSFPVDVWMARIMNEMYGIEETNKGEMTRYAREHFGYLGGFAQQYLFYYAREKSKRQIAGTCCVL